MKLLTLGNTKTVKGEAMGYQTYIMHLAPSTLSGYNTCPMASAGCALPRWISHGGHLARLHLGASCSIGCESRFPTAGADD